MTTARAVKAEQTRQSVLAVAQKLFAEFGYDATSLQMIADEMGVTKAAVYYHYRSKSDIIRELAGLVISELNSVMDEAETCSSRRDRAALLVRARVDQLLTKRQVIAIKQHDPGIHRELQAMHALDDLMLRGLHLLFGPSPSAADRAAYYLILSLDVTVPYLADLSTDELREALERTCYRLLRVAYPT